MIEYKIFKKYQKNPKTWLISKMQWKEFHKKLSMFREIKTYKMRKEIMKIWKSDSKDETSQIFEQVYQFNGVKYPNFFIPMLKCKIEKM